MKQVTSLRLQKNELRSEYKAQRKLLSAECRRQRDEIICKTALSLASLRYADYVLLYAATEYEINIDGIAKSALALGKKIAFPRCNTEKCTMTYHFVQSLDELSPDSYGIREPSESSPVYDPEISGGSAVVFVPGLLFDDRGYRLGYGKGYYDRYLSSFKGNKIGVVYGDFILPEVPIGRFDTKVDILLTEKRIKVIGQ